jgi:hypothetical protein
MLHALLAVGIWVLPWRFSVQALAMLSFCIGIGAAVIVTALCGWILFLTLCWRYA